MRSNRSLVVIALVLIVVAIIAGAAYLFFTGGINAITGLLGGSIDTPEVTPEVTPVAVTEIVVSVQSISRGMEISIDDNAIQLLEWPDEYLPITYYTDPAEIEGKFARMDIARGMPIQPDMIGQPGGYLAVNGSPAALFSPEDRVAYAIPMDTQGAVAWALRPGDRVDVLAALNMVTTSEFAGQDIKAFTFLEEQDLPSQSGIFGDFETLPNGRVAAIYPASDGSDFIPALLVQLTVQDAIVWNVGTWNYDEAIATPSPEEGVGDESAAPPADAAGYQDVEPVTLLVTRQDALVLKYLSEMGADLDLVLRPINVTGSVIQTQPVWFRYILDNYNMPNTMPDEPVSPSPVRDQFQLLPQVTPDPNQ